MKTKVYLVLFSLLILAGCGELQEKDFLGDYTISDVYLTDKHGERIKLNDEEKKGAKQMINGFRKAGILVSLKEKESEGYISILFSNLMLGDKKIKIENPKYTLKNNNKILYIIGDYAGTEKTFAFDVVDSDTLKTTLLDSNERKIILEIEK